MRNSILLLRFLVVVLMITIAVTVFAKLVGVQVALPWNDPVAQVIGREEGLATIGAALDLEHE